MKDMSYRTAYSKNPRAQELSRELEAIYMAERTKVKFPADVVQYVTSRWKRWTQESFAVILLDGSHNIMGIRWISRGLVNRTIVHPREVFRPAVRSAACAIIAIHNHPSGQTQFSPEDREVHTRLEKAGEIIGIPLLDSLVINRMKSYRSILEETK